MNAIFNTDAAILLWIQSTLRSPQLNPVVIFITHLGDKGILWIAVTLALLCFRRTRKLGLACMIAMVIGLAVTNLAIKNAVARVRPYELIAGLDRIIEAQHDWSFPSGHTTNSFACAWVLFRRAPKKFGVPALILAILIALSRLYVGVHYPTDVLGGLVIGMLSAILAMLIVDRIWKPLQRRARRARKDRARRAQR